MFIMQVKVVSYFNSTPSMVTGVYSGQLACG
jgi:hypothetical protein